MAVKICRICLALGVKVFKIGNSDAKSFIENIFKQSGYMQDLDGNHYICFECKALLDKSYNFIRRVLKAQEILFNVLKDNQIITPVSIQQIDRQIIGLNLVKVFKHIDVFITEDDEIKREGKAILVPEVKCKTEVDDIVMPDPLENSVDYIFDKKEVDIDFSLHFKDILTDTESNIDEKIPIHENESDNLFDNFDPTIQCEYVIEQVKDEILDDTECIDNKKNKKIKSTIKKSSVKKKSKKNASKVDPCNNSTLSDDKKNKNMNKPKKIPINENESDNLFDNFDPTIQYEYVIEQVKDEILDDTECIDNKKKKKRKSKPTIKKSSVKKKKKKTASKVQWNNSTISDDKKNKNMNKLKKKKEGELWTNYGPESYDGRVDPGQQIQQPDVPNYPAKCDHCNYEAPNKTAHFHHYLLEHKDKKYPYTRQTGKQFVCQFCGLVSNIKSRHIDHELTHGTVSNFVCSQCPKSFVNRHRLLKHTYRTHPLQMLECDYCGKKVKSRESIMIHLRAHTGERPFKCPFCEAGFAHRGNIRPHIRANHKECLEQSDILVKRNK